MSLVQVRDLCAAAGRCHAEGRTEHGLELARQAVEVCLKDLGEAHYAYPLSLVTLGWLQAEAGDQEGAWSQFQMAEALGQVVVQDDFEHGSAILQHVADFWRSAGDTVAVKRVQALLLESCRLHLGDGHPRFFAMKSRLDAST